MKKILVLGADPQARIIPDIIGSLDDLELIGFVEWGEGRKFLIGDAAGFPVFNGTQFPEEIESKLGPFEVIIAMSPMEKRKEVIRQVRSIPLIAGHDHSSLGHHIQECQDRQGLFDFTRGHYRARGGNRRSYHPEQRRDH